MNINEIINQLNKEKESINLDLSEKQKRMEEINITIKSLTDILYKTKIQCTSCNGTGQIFKRSCAEDDGEYKTCSKCHGYGMTSVS